MIDAVCTRAGERPKPRGAQGGTPPHIRRDDRVQNPWAVRGLPPILLILPTIPQFFDFFERSRKLAAVSMEWYNDSNSGLLYGTGRAIPILLTQTMIKDKCYA